MRDTFKKHLESNLNMLQDSRLLLAISGGLDSVVLAHLCHQLNLKVSLAHCNFNLRAAESDADEDFVLQLADDLDMEVFIESFETENYAKEEGLSIQMAARELRYTWFQELAEQLKFDYILTAHHADDNLETFLINLTRGTGLEGLTGIPEVTGKIVRPLLPFSREALKVYAIDQNIAWQEDSSNASTKYLRNKLRHDIIPILKQMNSQLLQNFQTTISNLQDSQDLIDDSVVRIQKKLTTAEDDQIKLDVLKLKQLSNPKAYLYQLLKDFNFTAWNDVVNLLDAQSGKQVFSSTHRLLKDREFLLLSEIASETDQAPIAIQKSDQEVVVPFGTLRFEHVTAIMDTGNTTIYVDAEKLVFPLILRKWQEGDVFYPLGMKGKKKKLSKYFKDEKLSLIEKEHIWILVSDDEVVWVVGKRADDRFKVTENTTKILKIDLQ
ncbi:tRNA lysidine(34) synthetase TilS [Gelidibacter salicanalis]|uniref:tRNA(Ile)-lysidine synthase n=1 Tax=Gelidibacter salicanalis TaxID=291193 RepID=A0A934NIE0_9FLAO|nr:tRNA lysidine(34) synthetase TilS [Gelidibacter salicanalis]MBJ7879974.1 tRNA lysidine(34) synthetase TilS [Gelidibacter salicanalis]